MGVWGLARASGGSLQAAQGVAADVQCRARWYSCVVTLAQTSTTASRSFETSIG